MATIATIATLLISAFPATDHRINRWKVVRPYNGKLERMAWCESRQRWHIATGNGYYGGLQFDLPTWRSAGGRGMPHRASELEQKYRAVLVIRRRGYQPWPVCGFR
jgi:resuscitation-promoting factor RpfA